MSEEPEIDDWETSSNTSGGPMVDDATAASTPEPAEAEPQEPEPTHPETTPAAAASEPEPRDAHGRFKPRHRARSAQAGPQDAPRIAELTRRLRETEAERDRLKNAPRLVERRQALAQQPAQAQQQPTPQPQPAPVSRETPPTRPEPTEDQIGTTYKTYAEFTRDQATWVWEQREAARQADEAQKSREKTHAERLTAYETKRVEARTRYADFDTVVAAVDHIAYTEPMRDAILSSDKAADIAYWLGGHPAEYHALNERSKAIQTFAQMELLRDVLESKLPPAAPEQRRPSRELAAVTGSVAPRTLTPAPRPPNPVRTGPLKTGDDLPGDDASIEEHEKFFHKGLRHGRRR